jgi:aryl-alcohol dehydrogenase-like predicted oxidoreductase
MKNQKIDRRNFLASSSLGFVGAGISSKIYPVIPDDEPPRIREYRTLGRTGFKVSDIGCGPAVINDENLLKAILRSGVNFIETAEFYGNGNNELLVGRSIGEFDRKSLFLNTKLIISQTDTAEQIVNRVRKCLERMKTDYLDSLMLWNPSSAEETKNVAFHAAFEQLKSEGKVKFCGISCHGSEYYSEAKDNMEKIICSAVEDGRFDLALFVYNYVQREMGANILASCARKNAGALLMKTDPFGKAYLDVLEKIKTFNSNNEAIPEKMKQRYEMILEKQKKADAFLADNPKYNGVTRTEAAIAFLLENPQVSSVIMSFRNYNDVAEYIGLSGIKLTSATRTTINSLEEIFSHLYCRHACGLCEKSCPMNVPVNTIMRYNHYYMAQGREKYAMQQYRNLKGSKADNCRNCEGHCENSCPYGVSIQALLDIAHNNLSFTV